MENVARLKAATEHAQGLALAGGFLVGGPARSTNQLLERGEPLGIEEAGAQEEHPKTLEVVPACSEGDISFRLVDEGA